MHIFLGFVIGALFYRMGNDATKTLFNFGFCFTVIIAFLYIPMMPVLIECEYKITWIRQFLTNFYIFSVPTQVQVLKREHFNRWYRCNPYYFAMSVAKLPLQLANSLLYLTMVYFITDQPIEGTRMALFYLISILTSLTSESFGLLISARVSVTVSHAN